MRTKEEYEQMELDTRPQLEIAIETVAEDAVRTALGMIERHYELAAENRGVEVEPVRNRHEAYGIAAEQLAKINGAVKRIKTDVDTLLGTLADPNYPALEVTSSIVNSAQAAAMIMIRATAEMKRTLDNLYNAENNLAPSPMEALASGGDDFQEAEDLPPEDADTGDDE